MDRRPQGQPAQRCERQAGEETPRQQGPVVGGVEGAVATVVQTDVLAASPARELSAFELEQLRRDLQSLRVAQARDYTRGRGDAR